jgi:hypothetical protein
LILARAFVPARGGFSFVEQGVARGRLPLDESFKVQEMRTEATRPIDHRPQAARAFPDAHATDSGGRSTLDVDVALERV